LEFDPEAELYAVVVPALPGCTSSGETVEECLVNAREAIRGHIAVLEAEGEPIPDEADGTVVIVASVAAERSGSTRYSCAAGFGPASVS
jgi:predicted RNase H-like HicB family nuclease